jgi:hypothetical protein
MKLWIVLTIFLLLVGSVAAISFYGNADFKGLYKIQNVTNITFLDTTYMTTAATGTTFTGNMSGGNLTSVNCIYFTTGNICG